MQYHPLHKYLDTVYLDREEDRGQMMTEQAMSALKQTVMSRPEIKIRDDWAEWDFDPDTAKLCSSLETKGECTIVIRRETIRQRNRGTKLVDHTATLRLGEAYPVELEVAHRLIKRWPTLLELAPQEIVMPKEDGSIELVGRKLPAATESTTSGPKPRKRK